MGYMTKNEIQKWHKKFLDWIEHIRTEIRGNGITFDCRLVGSAKRHLVIHHHNKGFDLDFQIILHKNKKALSEEKIKGLFMNLLNHLVVEEGFEYCKDSTSAITIKMIDTEKSKIITGYDVVLLKRKTVDGVENTEILRHYKDTKPEVWTFERLPDMTNAGEQFRKIQGPEMWQDLRQRYYNKKIKDTSGKKSFQLLHEAVNETLKQFGVN